MKLLIILAALLLSSCSTRDVGHFFLEDVTNSNIGYNAASCNQIKNSCEIANINNPNAFRQYSQWNNNDESIGCSCSNK
ncbi:hypothetical protein [Cognaticolwellia beringensis]|uniref:hypothetical protein n=1 Tax=Cognaticolwellia beringensis TaxID=1967665 RepID=UPI0012F9DE44|nr:hypothetical protein [Cognaticolwellia beringensis]